MFGEVTKNELISAFKEACEISAENGDQFIHKYIFKLAINSDETLNEEVDRKFDQLSEFARKVVESYNIGTTFQLHRPRDYMDQLKNLNDPKSQELRNKIYGAFYKAGHHIRQLTDRPDYIIPENAPTAQVA